jgi:hypothetical protein
MPRKQRTAQEVCTAYAHAVESVRVQTRIMLKHPCTEGNRKNFHKTGERECLDRHWQTVLEGQGVHAREVPELAVEDMCDACKTRLGAFEHRRDARKRLGAAKRAVEAIGKRAEAPDA